MKSIIAAILLFCVCLSASGDKAVRLVLWEVENQSSVHEVLQSSGYDFDFTVLTKDNATEFIENKLNNEYDAIFFPGGSGHTEATDLTPKGITAVRQFVKNGGGYIGICAGAYLATSNFSWSLHLINAAQKEPWDRGMGMVTINFTETGNSKLQVPYADIPIFYGQGPILKPFDDPSLPSYEVLAVYTSEIHSKHTNETKGQMVGTPAIITAPYGNGKVLLSSPHPELTKPPIVKLLLHYVLYVTGNL
eukprot:m.90987 g.90987  ORF g.90987 m.90987 type:complete len:248 (+) comp13285_c0_seq1:58-801(+)